MVTSDLNLKQRWLETLQAPPRQLVEMIIKKHLGTSPHLRIKMAIWMNVGQDPWRTGVELVEICGKSFGVGEPDFRPTSFAPHDGWPRLRLILTDVQSLVEDVAISGVATSYAEKIRMVLAQHGTEALIFPAGSMSPENDFRNCVGGVV